MPLDAGASSDVDVETLKIWRNSLASVVFPEDDGPERPMMMVVDVEVEAVDDILSIRCFGRRGNFCSKDRDWICGVLRVW